MKHFYSEKFIIKPGPLNIEVLGYYPGAQQRVIHLKEDSYKVLINGIEVDIAGSQLDLLIQSGIVKTQPTEKTKEEKTKEVA